MTASEMIREMIREKTVATPEEVAAVLAAHTQIVATIGVLERLAEMKEWEDIVLYDKYGSIRFYDFKPDWSCRWSGYGFSGYVADIRKQITAYSVQATDMLKLDR